MCVGSCSCLTIMLVPSSCTKDLLSICMMKISPHTICNSFWIIILRNCLADWASFQFNWLYTSPRSTKAIAFDFVALAKYHASFYRKDYLCRGHTWLEWNPYINKDEVQKCSRGPGTEYKQANHGFSFESITYYYRIWRMPPRPVSFKDCGWVGGRWEVIECDLISEAASNYVSIPYIHVSICFAVSIQL